MTIIHDAMDLTVQPPAQVPPPVHRTSLYRDPLRQTWDFTVQRTHRLVTSGMSPDGDLTLQSPE